MEVVEELVGLLLAGNLSVAAVFGMWLGIDGSGPQVVGSTKALGSRGFVGCIGSIADSFGSGSGLGAMYFG